MKWFQGVVDPFRCYVAWNMAHTWQDEDVAKTVMGPMTVWHCDCSVKGMESPHGIRHMSVCPSSAKL